MRQPLSIAILLVTLLGGPFVAGAELTRAEAVAVDRAVLQEMQRQELVGAALGILRNGEVVHAKGYGLADREKRRAFDESTLFNWASNSKPVMAVAAMQLVQAGRLDLDADVRDYVPEFPKKAGRVTTRQLLCHQSGIPHYSNGRVVPLEERPRGTEDDPVVSLARFGGSPLLFEPGARTSYSSYAYVLLSAVVQRAGGEAIDKQLNERIVKTLGMESFVVDGPKIGSNWAIGYQRRNGRVVRSPDVAHFWKHGAGAYKSNIGDFAKFGEALLRDRLVSARTRRLMWTPLKTNDGKTGTFALGFIVTGSGNALKISHNGSQEETRTRLVLYPLQRHGMVVATNCQHADPGRISTAAYAALASVRSR